MNLVRSPLLLAVPLLSCAAPEPDPTAIFQEMVEQHVRDSLKDPASANFKFGPYDLFPEEDLACGEVNSRNSYGGYGGFQGFVYNAGSVTFEETSMDRYLEEFQNCIDAVRRRTKELEAETKSLEESLAR